jgi:Fe-S cluster assembly iron-binding protein IscA
MIPFWFIVVTIEFLKLPIGKTFKIQNPKSKIQNGICSAAITKLVGANKP